MTAPKVPQPETTVPLKLRPCLQHLAAALAVLGTLPAAAQTFSYKAQRAAIPDNSTDGVEIPITVSGVSGTIQDLDVSLDAGGLPTTVVEDTNNGIDHPYVSDLRLVLVSPAGTEVVLADRVPANETDRNFASTIFDDAAAVSIQKARGQAPFAGRFRPADELALFNGEVATGTWKLKVFDLEAGDTGGVNRWSLHFKMSGTSFPTPPVVEVTAPPMDRTLANTLQSVVVAGRAADYDGTVGQVLYRLVPPGVDPATVPWRNPANDSGNWSAWSFTADLEVGANVVEMLAIDAAGRESAYARRILNRDEPVYNGAKPDFAGMDGTTDVNVALTRSTGVTPSTRWLAQSGLRTDLPTGWLTLACDFTGDGYADLVAVDPQGDLYTARNTGQNSIETPVKTAADFVFNEYDGWSLFAGDCNGDGRQDLVQITPVDGAVYVAASNGLGFDTPVLWGETGFQHRPNEEHWVSVGDVNADGKADLVYLSPTGVLSVALASAATFDLPAVWADTGFFRSYRGTTIDPQSATPAFLCDPNGDSRMDVGFLDNNGVVWFAISNGASFSAPQNWGTTSLVYAPYLGFGWHIFAGDINGDAMMDVVQFSQFGDIRVALSTGNRIEDPGANIFATPGFRHTVLGPDRILIGNFGD
ncbi:MAG: large repetitive protein [Candidatus Sumerlaeota bacterium]|nr:large repetitive protein [Candidatus Sumerlaeota bacterium]